MSGGLFDGLFVELDRLQQEVDFANEQLENQQYIQEEIVENEKQPIFDDNEILELGLYPKDEKYKMSLISKILSKR